MGLLRLLFRTLGSRLHLGHLAIGLLLHLPGGVALFALPEHALNLLRIRLGGRGFGLPRFGLGFGQARLISLALALLALFPGFEGRRRGFVAGFLGLARGFPVGGLGGLHSGQKGLVPVPCEQRGPVRVAFDVRVTCFLFAHTVSPLVGFKFKPPRP